MPHFSHGPKIRRLSDGRFALIYLGCGVGFETLMHNCTGGVTDQGSVSDAWEQMETKRLARVARSGRAGCNQFNVSIRTADRLTGP